MAVISFRSPQEGLEQYQKALDLISLVHAIVYNPDTQEHVASLSKQFLDSQKMSEEQKKELQESQEIIAQSKEFLDEFEAEKATHNQKVGADLAEIKRKNEQLQSDLSNFTNVKNASKKELEKYKAEADDVLAKAKKLSEGASVRHQQVDERQEKLNALEAEYFEKSNKLKADQEHHEMVVVDELSKHEEKVKKLAEERASFEARKNRFESALKE